MGKNNPDQKDKEPKCLAALDFQILCELEGKDKAVEIMLMAAALGKERAMDSNSGSHSHSKILRPPLSMGKITSGIQPVNCSQKQGQTDDITVPIVFCLSRKWTFRPLELRVCPLPLLA